MYDRNLIEYLPPFLRDVREYKALLTDAEQPEMVLVWQSVNNTLNDQFITDATENGVSRWEKILGIVPKATLTLDERKFTILTKINEQLPFTITTLKEQLETLCGEDGYSLTLNNEKYTLDVKIALTARNNFEDVNLLLQRVVPANLVVTISLKYNQQEALAKLTHEQLKVYTHYELRNEVLSNGN
jgi:uncharacterized protein YmfQ (DUF2313 family)